MCMEFVFTQAGILGRFDGYVWSSCLHAKLFSNSCQSLVVNGL